MSYRFVEHTAEIELELEAASESGLFAAALEALAELVSPGDGGKTVRHEIELPLDDRTLILVDWLNELLFLVEVEQFVPERLVSFASTAEGVRSTVVGRRGRPRHLVKAVTLSGAELREEGGMWHARLVLDV